jgi:hypothetical protein
MNVLTLGYHFRKKKKQQEQRIHTLEQLGDYNYWPFFQKANYDAQLNNPPFLIGKQRL